MCVSASKLAGFRCSNSRRNTSIGSTGLKSPLHQLDWSGNERPKWSFFSNKAPPGPERGEHPLSSRQQRGHRRCGRALTMQKASVAHKTPFVHAACLEAVTARPGRASRTVKRKHPPVAATPRNSQRFDVLIGAPPSHWRACEKRQSAQSSGRAS